MNRVAVNIFVFNMTVKELNARNVDRRNIIG